MSKTGLLIQHEQELQDEVTQWLDRRYSKEWKENIGSEIGDVLWYCAVLADDLGISLGKIAADNEKKLTKRKSEGMISGSGDNR